MFIAPDLFMPIVNEEQMGAPRLNKRATEHGVFESMGHLKPGVTPAQAVTDVMSLTHTWKKLIPETLFTTTRRCRGRA